MSKILLVGLYLVKSCGICRVVGLEIYSFSRKFPENFQNDLQEISYHYKPYK